jgi:acyl-ACP thioesterase
MNEQREDSYTLCTWDCDSSSRLTPCAAFNFCQETAGRHAVELGVGTPELAECGLAWILSRMSLSIERRPRWGEAVRVRTWPRGTERLFARRDFELADAEGRPFGRGRSAWLILDVASRRPRRPEIFAEGLPSNEGRDALTDGISSLEAAEGLQPVYTRFAAYSDLDYNGHVNNARYVQWLQDALDCDALVGAASFRVDINYLAEVRLGDGVVLHRGPARGDFSGERVSVEGRLEGSGSAAFRAEVLLGR